MINTNKCLQCGNNKKKKKELKTCRKCKERNPSCTKSYFIQKEHNWNKQIVTINIPDAYIKAFENLIDLALFNNRSEIVRRALKEFFQLDQIFVEDLNTESQMREITL